ncbi:MAG: hypothetical protein GC181_14165 [Bacteroidetes bacterium]|nr:hypothetical protein [Bacteroidota bacterium]
MTILFLTVGQLFGQDTTTYRQANASMFSNNYTFIKQNKSDNSGTFNQRTRTDDGQYWYGQGTFEENKQKIYLTFDTTECNPRIETKKNENHRDTLYIRWFDWWGNRQEWFTVRFTDTTSNKSYHADWQTSFIKIPMTELKNKKLSLYGFSSTRKVVDLEVPIGVNEVNIFANDSLVIHTYNKSNEELSKRKNGFITVGMWTKGKRTLFLKREK